MVLEENSFYVTISLLSMQLLKELSQPFCLTYGLLIFFHYFFNSKLCLICLLQLFFVKRSKNLSSPLKLFSTSVHKEVFLTFLIIKASSNKFGCKLKLSKSFCILIFLHGHQIQAKDLHTLKSIYA